MKRAKFIIFLTAILLSLPNDSRSQEAEGIIKKAVLAVGGERYLHVKTLVIAGESKSDLSIIGQRQSEFTIYTKGPLYRNETLSQGTKAIIGFDGSSYWMYVNGKVITPREAVIESLRNRYKTELASLANPSQAGIDLKYARRKDQDGTGTYLVEARYADNDIRTFYFDQGSYLLQRIEHAQSGLLGLGKKVIEIVFKDYRSVNGLRFAFVKEVYVDQKKTVEERIREIKLDTELNDDLFKRP